MIPDKIYHFLGYNNLGLMIDQERKHWLMKTDKMKRLQDKSTGDVFQGTVNNLGSDIIIETSKLPIKAPTNDSFKWKDYLKMEYIVNVEKSPFTYSSAVNGLMFARIVSINYPVDLDSDDVRHYRIQFNDCETCLIPFGGSTETDDVFVGKWIKTNTPPVLQVMDTDGNYTISLDVEFDPFVITGATFYYPLEETLQALELTAIDTSTYVTAGVVDNQYIGYPLFWFTCDQSIIGPTINIQNNVSGMGKQLMMAGNAGNENKYYAHLYVNVDGDQNATPDDSPTSGWYVVCNPAPGESFKNNSLDYSVKLDHAHIRLNDYEFGISIDGDSKVTMSVNDGWVYVDAATYKIPLSTFESNCLESYDDNTLLTPVFDVKLDDSIPFVQSTKDAGHAGIRATASNDFSDVQTRYPYDLNKWSGLPEWLNEGSEDAVPQHTIVYALHNTPSSVEGSPETLQTAALILDPGKRHEEDPLYNLDQYNREKDFVEFILANPPTEAQAQEIRSKYTDPNFDTTLWDYTSRCINNFSKLRTVTQFAENPACCSTDYVWNHVSAEYINSHVTVPDSMIERATMHSEWMRGLLNNTAYHVIIDDYIHDATSIKLMEMYERYHTYTDFIDKHPMSLEEQSEIMNLYKKYGCFPIILRGDLNNDGTTNTTDLDLIQYIISNNGSYTLSLTTGDVDLDGTITYVDAFLLLASLVQYTNPNPTDANIYTVSPSTPKEDLVFDKRPYFPDFPAGEPIQLSATATHNGILVAGESEPSLLDVVLINRIVLDWEILHPHTPLVVGSDETINIGFTELEVMACDMDHDGKITQADVELLSEYIENLNHGSTYPEWLTIQSSYVDRVMADFKKLVPFSLFEQLPNQYTADYIWNDKETTYPTGYPDFVIENLWNCVVTQLILTTAYRMITNNYIHDMSEIYNNDERGRAYVLSNDSPEYVNNRTADAIYKKPDRTVARICDIPTSAMQLTGISGLSPTQVVDKAYIRQQASYSLEDKDRLYNKMASKWVRPTALSVTGNPVAEHKYVFSSVDELNRVDLLYHNNFRKTVNLVPMVPPNKVHIANIYNGGSNYLVSDIGILMIGGYAFNYVVTEVDNIGSVRDATLYPSHEDFNIHISNFDMQSGDMGVSEVYGTSPITGSGTGLKLRLFIEDYKSYITNSGEIFDDLYAFVSEDDGVWVYTYIINTEDYNTPHLGYWKKCDQLTKYETSNYNVDGSITSPEAMITTILPQRRQIAVPLKTNPTDNSVLLNGELPSLDTLTTASFINIIDTNKVPMDISNVVADTGKSKTEVDLCAWQCDGIVTLTAQEKTSTGVIETLNQAGLLHEQCHIFFKWTYGKQFEAGVIYQGFNNYRSTDTTTLLPDNDFKWKRYITSNPNTTVVWNTDESGVMMWIYDPLYNCHERYAIDIDSKELAITRKKDTWKDFKIRKSNTNADVKLVSDKNIFQYTIMSNCTGYTTSTLETNSSTLHAQFDFMTIAPVGSTYSDTMAFPYVCAGNWRLVFPRLHSFTFRNDSRNISYNAIEMQTIMSDLDTNPGDIINEQSGFQVNQKTLLVNRSIDGSMELKLFNNETSTWEKI